MSGLAIRAVVAALLLLGVAAYAIDWQTFWLPADVYRTLDARLEGDVVHLRAQVAGQLVAAPVRDDGDVARGDLLFQIDPSDYRLMVERAGAEMLQAEGDLVAATAALAQQMPRIEAAEARMRGGEAAHVQAMQERTRQAGLLHTESYLARDWESAVAAERGASAGLDGQRRALTVARAQVNVLQAQVAAAQAALDGKRAALALAKVQLGYTSIVAPADARTAQRLVRTGDYVAPGTSLIALVPRRAAWVVANFREEQLRRMMPGQPAHVSVDAIPGAVFHGHVDSLAATSEADTAALRPDRSVGNFTRIVQRVPVKILIDGPDDARLRPGQSAEAEVDCSGGAP